MKIFGMILLLIAGVLGEIPLAQASCVVLQNIVPLDRNASAAHDRFVQNLEAHRLSEGANAYLVFENSDGQTVAARFLKEADSEGVNGIMVMTETGQPLWINPLENKSLRMSPESAEFFEGKASEAKAAFLDQSLLKGDAVYLTYTTAKGRAYQLRVHSFEADGDKTILQVQSLNGNYLLLPLDRMERTLISPYAKKMFLETTLLTGEKVEVSKFLKAIAQRKEKLLSGKPDFDIAKATSLRISNVGKDPDKLYQAYLLSSGIEDSNTGKFAESVQRNFNTHIIYSAEANDALGSNGFTSTTVRLHAPEGDESIYPVKVINEQELVTRDLPSDTQVHESGHMKTHDSLEKGKPDPGGIRHYALADSSLPTYGQDNFYSKFSQADESRQHALNFHNAVHQRHSSELYQEFNVRKKIPIAEAFGVTRRNFLLSTELADTKLSDLRVLNDRHYELAQDAGTDLIRYLNPKNYDPTRIFITKNEGILFLQVNTNKAVIQIPVVGEWVDATLKSAKKATIVTAPDGEVITQISYDLKNGEDTMAKLQEYGISYLKNEINMLNEQNLAILDSRIKLKALRASPRKQITYEQYLDTQNTFTRVKTSMNYLPEQTEFLKWNPRSAPPPSRDPLPRKTAPRAFHSIYQKSAPEN